jgi:hypothetical protein
MMGNREEMDLANCKILYLQDSSFQNWFRTMCLPNMSRMSYRCADGLGASTKVTATYTREHQVSDCGRLLSSLLLGDAKTEKNCTNQRQVWISAEDIELTFLTWDWVPVLWKMKCVII